VPRLRRVRAIVIVAIILTAVATVWAWTSTTRYGGADRLGTAIRRPAASVETILAPLPVGSEWADMLADIQNTRHHPITIQRVILRGSGIGHVIVQVQAAKADPRPATPTGVFQTDPPVVRYQGSCLTASFVPLAGLVLPARTTADMDFVLRAERPGRFFIHAEDVYYTDRGHPYHQLLVIGFKGHVQAGAKPIHRPSYERSCIAHTTGLPLGGG
jgi:hypothetical protein